MNGLEVARRLTEWIEAIPGDWVVTFDAHGKGGFSKTPFFSAAEFRAALRVVSAALDPVAIDAATNAYYEISHGYGRRDWMAAAVRAYLAHVTTVGAQEGGTDG